MSAAASASETVRPGTVWTPAEDAAVRGTLVFVPGRGETAGVYARFGRRLAADGYVVHVPEITADTEPASVAAAFAEAATRYPAPVALGGSDVGALYAAGAVARDGVRPAGLILVGLPVADTARSAPLDWEDELAARTACPAHRGVLASDPDFARGALAAAAPDELPSVKEVLISGELPVLVLHGEADPVAPITKIRDLAASSARTTLVAVSDGRHDVLNDAAHRSVAAQIVQWLERLRGGPGQPRVLTVEEPSS
ncbi:alpha/beta hydrolase [Yinghuangia sp. ASG 101]|uniref:alpha/beta hydrolase n=1 Tax=Yinghuangia sp. ASG 101 TaxID=2896848 RepID=UPI001E2D63C1|nr:alpha/beta hydrolase [Yinghuangia sp. ASG 101]UGQ12126.1 alpha/beta hydrolase [Yinghuangia sp. ASG 101]